jgi:hypothetical protein
MHHFPHLPGWKSTLWAGGGTAMRPRSLSHYIWATFWLERIIALAPRVYSDEGLFLFIKPSWTRRYHYIKSSRTVYSYVIQGSLSSTDFIGVQCCSLIKVQAVPRSTTFMGREYEENLLQWSFHLGKKKNWIIKDIQAKGDLKVFHALKKTWPTVEELKRVKVHGSINHLFSDFKNSRVHFVIQILQINQIVDYMFSCGRTPQKESLSCMAKWTI